MIIETLHVGPISTSCYILQSKTHPTSCLLIDPGADPLRIQKSLGPRRPAAILLTHGHFDHIAAVQPLMSENTQLLIHSSDAPMLSDPSLNASLMLMGRPVTAPAPTDLLRDEQELTLAGLTVRVLHTPGHTPGSVCFLIEDHLFTGDTLFTHGWGRTDLPGGDEHQLFASLRRLMPLSREYPVHPGHPD